MIGALLNMGVSMAAYAASAKAMTQGARWLSSAFRRGVSAYTRYAENMRVRGPVTNAAYAALRPGGGLERGTAFVRDAAKGASARLRSNLTPSMNRAMTFLGRQAVEEASFFPANYVFYRMEKHRAVTPDERENTRSFMKYYFGAPMLMSIASGAVMTNISKLSKTTAMKIARKTTPVQRRNAVRAVSSVARVGSFVADLGVAAARTRKTMTAQRGVLSILSQRTPMELLDQIPRVFRQELSSLEKYQGPAAMLQQQIRDLGEQMNRIGKNPAGRGRKYARYEEDMSALKNQFERKLMQDQIGAQAKPNSFETFFGWISKELKDPSMNLERVTRDVLVGGKTFSVHAPGHYRIGSTEINFGRMSAQFMKDSLIKASGTRLPKLFLAMFGQDEILAYHHSEHALGAAFTSSREGHLYLPRSYHDEKASALDMMTTALGGDRERAGLFLENRVNLVQRQHGKIPGTEQYRLNRDVALAHMKRHLEHGSIPMHAGDMLIHRPGGALEVMTNIKVSEAGVDKIMPMSFQVGGMEDGSFLSFLKFTRSSSSRSAKMMRILLGQENIKFRDVRGESFISSVGPNQEGKVIREKLGGFISTIKNTFDLGYSQERSVFSAIGSIFRKHADPRYPRTLFGRDYLESRAMRETISGSERMVKDTIDVMHRESKEAMEYAVAGISAHMKDGTTVASLYHDIQSPIEQFLVSPLMGIKEGKERIDEFSNYLYGLSKESTPDSAIHEDIAAVRRVRELFFEGSNKTVGEAMNVVNVEAPRRMIRGKIQRIPKIDEYNATVLRIMHSEMGSKAATEAARAFQSVVPDEKILSAFHAASHMSSAYHKLGKQLANSAAAPDGIRSNADAIEAILSSFTGSAHYDDVLKYYQGSMKHMPFMPWDYDSRPKVERIASEEIFAIPRGAGTGMVTRRSVPGEGGDMINIAHGIIDAGNIGVMSLFHAFNRVTSQVGLGLDEYSLATPVDFFRKTLTHRVLPFMGVYMGYQALDRAADATLNGTPFGEGLTVFGANVLAGARVAAQSMLDFTHVTDAAKYLEDVMPGIITSPAGGLVRGLGPVAAGMSIGFKAMGSKGGLMGGAIGAGVGMLMGGGPLGMFGLWNIDKSREEVIRELTGKDEIAVRKGRWWELGKSDFSGGRVEYYRPHIYAITRSQYKDVPGLKDGIFTDIAGTLAPDLYAVKNYYSRPYPATAGLFADLPVFGSMMSALPGLPFGGGIRMHEDRISPLAIEGMAQDAGINTNEIAGSMSGDYGYFAQTGGHGRAFNLNYEDGLTEIPMDRASGEWALGESVMNMKDILGMRGFIMGSAFAGLSGRQDLFDYAPELATPVDVMGIRRQYWDLEMGGMLGLNEGIRRYLPHKRNQMQVYNPIRNTMPDYLPGKDYYLDFKHGDPYSVVPLGETRLPGASYETLHRVDLAFPVEGEILGESVDSQVAYYLGLPEQMTERNRLKDIASSVSEELSSAAMQYGELVRKTSSIYNPRMDIHATIDGILKTPLNEKIAMKVTAKGMDGTASLNAYMVMGDIDRGLLLEVDPDSGSIAERMVTRDVQRFQNELARNAQARTAAYASYQDLEDKGKAMNLANAYSWVDRMKILGDVAPWSKEFTEAQAIVQKQIGEGMLTPRQIGIYHDVNRQVEEKNKAFNFTEYRFLNLGGAMTPEGKARESQIYEEYSPLERMVGAGWERFSHLRTPVHSKLLHQRSALEEYEQTSIYGKRMPMWEHPYEDFLKSYAYSMTADDDPLQAGVSWATGGMLMGGFPLAGAMSAIGAFVGTYNNLTGRTFVPQRVEDMREIVEQYDAVEYAKLKDEYARTGRRELATRAGLTITGTAMNGSVIDSSMMKFFAPYPEKDFASSIIQNISASDIERAGQILPDYIAASMYKEVGETNRAQGILTHRTLPRMMDREIPALDSSIYSESVPLEVPAIQTMEQEGMNAHDAGMGWYSQVSALERAQRLELYKPGDTLYANTFEPRVNMQDFASHVDMTAKIRELCRKYARQVQMYEDGAERIEIEVIL